MVALKRVRFQAGMIAGPVVFGFAFVADESLPYMLAVLALMLAVAIVLFVPCLLYTSVPADGSFPLQIHVPTTVTK